MAHIVIFVKSQVDIDTRRGKDIRSAEALIAKAAKPKS